MAHRSTISLVAFLCCLVGCGTDAGQTGGGSFAIDARWQQPVGSQLADAPCPAPSATAVPAFAANPLPPVVNTVRVALAGPNFSCCIDLDRDTAEQRRVQISGIPTGSVLVTLSAYLEAPGGSAPLDAPCDTDGVGVDCTTGPSTLTYTSDATSVAVVPGATNIVQIVVHSVPFLLKNFVVISDRVEVNETLSPAPGGTSIPGGQVLAALVDATTPVCNPAFFVTQGTTTEPRAILTPCDDSGFPPCSSPSSGCLAVATPGATPPAHPCQVRGLILSGNLPIELESGPASIEFNANNFAGASFTTAYTFEVSPTATATPRATDTLAPTTTATATATATPRTTDTLVPTTTATAIATATARDTDTPTPTTPPDTPTLTPTPTVTATPTDTPRPSDAMIIVDMVSGQPGDTVAVDVTLRTLLTTTEVAGTENAIAFEASAAIPTASPARPACSANEDIEKDATSFAFLPPGCTGTGCTGVRAIVLALNNVDAIPDGSVLYTCQVVIAGDASGIFPLTCSNPGSQDPDGAPLLTSCVDGSVTVSGPTLPSTPTVTPTVTPTGIPSP